MYRAVLWLGCRMGEYRAVWTFMLLGERLALWQHTLATVRQAFMRAGVDLSIAHMCGHEAHVAPCDLWYVRVVKTLAGSVVKYAHDTILLQRATCQRTLCQYHV
jgi:hypothetical protein